MTTQAQRTAQWILDIGAVNFNADEPFKLTSGRMSPVYMDCRRFISYPDARRDVMNMGATLLREACDIDTVDFIAGGETAGIPYAAWLSEILDKPMLYVRKKPKGFGRNAQIEGDMPEGAKVILVEDMTTDGGSKIAFVKALRTAGATISDVFSIFFYDTFPTSKKLFADEDLTLRYLATWKDVLAEARTRNAYSQSTLNEVEKFLADPEGWSLARGGIAQGA